MIGPAGVVVVDDKFQSWEVHRGSDGTYWSARSRMTGVFEKAVAQAEVVGRTLGTASKAILAIHGAGVRPGDQGVVLPNIHLVNAADVAHAVAGLPRFLDSTAALEMAEKAVRLFHPRELHFAGTGGAALDQSALFTEAPPSADRRPSARRPVRRRTRQGSRRSRGQPQAIWRVGLGVVVLIGLSRYADSQSPTPPPEELVVAGEQRFESAEGTLLSRFLCHPSNVGFTHEVSAVGITMTAADHALSGGPWAPMTVQGGKAAAEGLRPGTAVLVRINRAGVGQPPNFAEFFDQVPKECPGVDQ